METTTTVGAEWTDGIDLDGNRPRHHEHEGARDGRGSGLDLESEVVALAFGPLLPRGRSFVRAHDRWNACGLCGEQEKELGIRNAQVVLELG
jgi:hypothetical protein